MTVSEKIKFFFQKEKKLNKEIGDSFGTSSQTIGNYLNGKREIPIDFLVWLKSNYPEVDFNKLFSGADSPSILNEINHPSKISKEEILQEIEVVLSRHLK